MLKTNISTPTNTHKMNLKNAHLNILFILRLQIQLKQQTKWSDKHTNALQNAQHTSQAVCHFLKLRLTSFRTNSELIWQWKQNGLNNFLEHTFQLSIHVLSNSEWFIQNLIQNHVASLKKILFIKTQRAHAFWRQVSELHPVRVRGRDLWRDISGNMKSALTKNPWAKLSLLNDFQPLYELSGLK